eukprot:1693247-Alexandrium_andersonii.AAC.1
MACEYDGIMSREAGESIYEAVDMLNSQYDPKAPEAEQTICYEAKESIADFMKAVDELRDFNKTCEH